MILPTCQFPGDSQRVVQRKLERQNFACFARVAFILIFIAALIAPLTLAFNLTSAWAGETSDKSANKNTGKNAGMTIQDMLALLDSSRSGQLIDAPVLPPEPVTVTVAKKNANAQSTASKSKQREAQIRSIVSLFAKYNKELNGEKGRKYAEYIIQAGEKFNQDPFVIAAMIVHESSARNDAVSKGGDYGLMQIRWKVHQEEIKKKYPNVKQAKDIFDPKTNVLIGTEIFADCRKTNDVRSGLLRYSAGNTKLVNKVSASIKILQDSYQKNLRTMS